MLFSVIIPVYNKKDTSASSLDSVLSQNIEASEYEIIIVDDGSTDCDYGQFERDGVRVITQINGGVSKARNVGIQNAKGEFICFLDADDYYLPNNLSTLRKAIEQTNKDFYSTIPIISYKDGSKTNGNEYLVLNGNVEEVDIFEFYLKYPFSFIHTNSVCIRKKLLEKIHFENGVKIGEDFDLWFRLGMQTSLSLIYANTIVYDRNESTATADRYVVADWIFARRTENENFFDNVSADRAFNIRLIIDRYYMTEAREYKIKNQLLQAKQTLKKVKFRRNWRYFVTNCFIYCPRFMMSGLIRLYDKYQDR